MRTTLFSKLVLVAVCGAAAVGWSGMRLAPAAEDTAAAAALAVPAAQPGVRNRDAWQPSPIPTKQETSSASAPAPEGAALAPARNRAAWQPSPIPSTSGTGSRTPQGSRTDGSAPPSAIGGATIDTAAALQTQNAQAPAPPVPALGVPAPAPATGLGALLSRLLPNAFVRPAPAPIAARPEVIGAESYTPMSALFTAPQLEALYAGGLPAARGTWQEVAFYSRALGRDTSYLVWLPPGYATATADYPTLYLLHGAGGPEGSGVEEWLGYALTEDLDRLLALGLLQPMLVVLPNGEQGYWMNHAPDSDGTRWADFVAQDLVRHVDATFRTDPRRERRAVGGLSMGGHGALQLALTHPEVFAVAGAHSPTIRDWADSPPFFGDPAWFARYDPLTLARSTPNGPQVATWIDVGSADPWRTGAAQVAAALEAKGAPVDFHVLEGEHEGWYWEYYLPEYLNFYSAALHATAATPQGAPVVPSRFLMDAIAGITSSHS